MGLLTFLKKFNFSMLWARQNEITFTSTTLGWRQKSQRQIFVKSVGGKKMPKQSVYLQSTQGEWENHFFSYLTTFIYWALFCLQDTELQFQRKRKKYLIKKAEFFGGLSLAVLVDYAASKCTPTRSISVNAYYSSDNTSAIFWELSEILK